MLMLEGLVSTLAEMGSAQLATLFVALAGYLLAINRSFGTVARSSAASAAFLSGAGFGALAPSWMSGVVFLALAVLSVALFVGAAWLLSALLGIREEGALVVIDEGGGAAPVGGLTHGRLRGFAVALMRSL
jgi:hypothetical protein